MSKNELKSNIVVMTTEGLKNNYTELHPTFHERPVSAALLQWMTPLKKKNYYFLLYLEQKVAHVGKTAFSALLEAVEIVSSQDAETLYRTQ